MDTYKVAIKIVYENGTAYKWLDPEKGTHFHLKVIPHQGGILKIAKYYYRVLLTEYAIHEKKTHISKHELDVTILAAYIGLLKDYKLYVKNTFSM